MSNESYFKRGARVKPERRIELTEAVVALEPVKPNATAYAYAMAHIHKPWARRWIKARGLFV